MNEWLQKQDGQIFEVASLVRGLLRLFFKWRFVALVVSGSVFWELFAGIKGNSTDAFLLESSVIQLR